MEFLYYIIYKYFYIIIQAYLDEFDFSLYCVFKLLLKLSEKLIRIEIKIFFCAYLIFGEFFKIVNINVHNALNYDRKLFFI